MKVSFNIDDRLVSFGGRVLALARHRATHALVGVSILVGAGATAHAATKPHTFSAGAAALAAQINANFDAIFAAVTDLEDAKQSQSILWPGSTANRNLAISNGGYFYAHPSYEQWGQVPVTIPVGSVITGMTCYVYNNSGILASSGGHFTATLERLDVMAGDSVTLAEFDEWPAQSAEVQDFDVALPSGGLEVEADNGYFLQMNINPGDATEAEYYPPNDSTVARRVLRHYGCRLEFDAP